MSDPLLTTVDNRALISPYKIGQYIWEIVSPYFEKYDIAISEAYPQEKVSKPTVVWKTRNRKPGSDGGRIRSKGATYAGHLGVSNDGLIDEFHQMDYTLMLEFSVFGTSSAVLDDIAWDLENAIKDAEGPLQRKIKGFAIHFSEQWSDQGLSVRLHDAVIYRTLIFQVLVPVWYIKRFRQIRGVDIAFFAGRLAYQGIEFTRTSLEETFTIPVDKYKLVTDIIEITIVRNNEIVILERDTDYTVEQAAVGHSQIIRWNDDHGLVPAVDENFRVTYAVASRFLANVYKKFVER